MIDENKAQLIYAGGDDICAICYTRIVLDIAYKIHKIYNSSFNLVKRNTYNDIDYEEILTENFNPSNYQNSKLLINLGYFESIFISAGIIITHEKENLSGVIKRGYQLLKKAKEEGGRNAVAIEVKKRSGGSKLFITKKYMTKLGYETLEVELVNKSRLLIGLAESHPGEVGFLLDYNLGIPYILATSIKGLVRFTHIFEKIKK
ncbi:MAG TPA: hypothetical protein PLP99_06365 [Ignavibacteriales bacterium]|nr:hypothetical protein [Ignavibacteriales bacterium]